MLFVLLAAHGIETNPGPSYSNEKDKLLTSLSTKVNDLEDQLSTLQTDYQKMLESNKILAGACLLLEQRCESLESQGRRQNILIHNMPSTTEEPESWNDTEEKVKGHFKDMGLEEEIKIDRAHRLNPRKVTSPVVVRLTYYKDREKILEKSRLLKREKREKNKHDQTDYPETNEQFITEDFSNRVRKARSLLRPGLLDALKNNKRAYLSYDKLVIDGKAHWYDDVKKSVSETKPEIMSCSELYSKLHNLK